MQTPGGPGRTPTRPETVVRGMGTSLYEAIFAIFLGSLLVLGRLEPGVLPPSLLWTLLFILIFNLGCLQAGRRRRLPGGRMSWCHFVNTLAVFGVLRETGGAASIYWVAFLLPVFGSIVSDRRRGPWPIVAAASVLLGLLYAAESRGAWSLLEWAVKSGSLAFAGAVTLRGRLREERLRKAVDEKRLHLEYLAARMIEDHLPIREEGDLVTQVERRLRLVENPLSVIEESLRIAQLEAPVIHPDLKRIEACHKLLKSLTQDLFDILYRDEYWIKPASFEEVHDDVLKELRYPLAAKELRVLRDFAPDLPQVPMSRPHVEQLLRTVLGRAALACEARQAIEVRARLAGLMEEPYLEVQVVHPGTGDVSSLPHLKRIAEKHGGWLRYDYRTRTVALTLALPLHGGIRLKPPFRSVE